MTYTHRLEIKIDSTTREWLQQFSQTSGKSQAEITRGAIAKVQLELNDKTPIV